MHRSRTNLNNENGSAMVIALMVLLLLTVIGLAASNTTIREYNSVNQEARYKECFMVSDSGQMREAQEIGSGGYENLEGGRKLNPMSENEPLEDRTPTTDDPLSVGGVSYEPSVTYRGAHPPNVKGTSSAQFSQYDYGVDVQACNVRAETAYAKFGIKAGS